MSEFKKNIKCLYLLEIVILVSHDLIIAFSVQFQFVFND